jgi:hypothetical protein
MGFKDRTNKGEAFFKECAQFFSNLGYIVVKTGIEEHYSKYHPDLVKIPNDLTSQYFRYHPDGFYIATKDQKSVYFDAKDSKAIEKDAFQIYELMMKMGLTVILCIKVLEDIPHSKSQYTRVYQIPIQNVKLISGIKSVSEYPNPLPVDIDDWIAPRLLSKEAYIDWKNQHSLASGTPFRYFDFANMKEYLVTNYWDVLENKHKNEINDFVF